MLTVYDWTNSPNCLKIRILLNELGLEYEERAVDRARMQSADYRVKFPTAQAPAIEDGDVRLCESSAIALYLAEKAGALVPKDAKRRALMHQAISIESALLAPTMGGQGLFGELARPESERNHARIAELQQKAQEVARILGAMLGPRPYFAEEMSVADIQLYAATSKSVEAGAFIDPPANVVAWVARMTARPAVAAARERYVHFRTQAA